MPTIITLLIIGIIFYVLIALFAGSITFLVLTILFSMFPGRHRDTTAFTTVRYAHRGLHSGDGKFPENSLKLFDS